MTEYSLSDYVAKYIELRDKKAEIENRHKDELAPTKEAMECLENYFGEFLEQNDMQSFKTPNGTPYRSKKLSIRMEDKGDFVTFAWERAQDLLDIRASITGVQQFLERNEGAVIPGIKLEYRYNVNVRRK